MDNLLQALMQAYKSQGKTIIPQDGPLPHPMSFFKYTPSGVIGGAMADRMGLDYPGIPAPLRAGLSLYDYLAPTFEESRQRIAAANPNNPYLQA